MHNLKAFSEVVNLLLTTDEKKKRYIRKMHDLQGINKN